jgi:hypothetical protein
MFSDSSESGKEAGSGIIIIYHSTTTHYNEKYSEPTIEVPKHARKVTHRVKRSTAAQGK